MLVRVRNFLGNAISRRVLIALVPGLLIGLLVGQLNANPQNAVPYLLFPLVIGMAGALTISARNPRPYLTALTTGLAVWAGISIYLLITSAQTASNPCTLTSCESSNASVTTALLLAYFSVSLLLVTMGALSMRVLLRYYHRHAAHALEQF